MDISTDIVPCGSVLFSCLNGFSASQYQQAIRELVRCVALTRICYGDPHWKLAEAHVNLAQGYLQLRGEFSAFFPPQNLTHTSLEGLRCLEHSPLHAARSHPHQKESRRFFFYIYNI